MTVLVIENNAAEAALVAAALALRPGVQVLDAPDEREAAMRLESPRCPVVLAVAGAAALAAPPAALFKRLGDAWEAVEDVALDTPGLPALYSRLVEQEEDEG